MKNCERFQQTLDEIRAAGLYKQERIITTPQGVSIRVQDGREVLNFCANNYLGLADHPEVIAAAHQALDEHGFGLASVRFICGTQDLHKELEAAISHFFGTDDTILYTSCFDANGGLFETILGPEDAVISDALNHASIIDGIRLCKAQRHRYPNSDMAALEQILQDTQACRSRLIATDGAFSMDGFIAKLDEITRLAERYDAMLMVDDSHATGFMGKTGRGTWEHCGVAGRIDVITTTFGKALGGALGGCTAGSKEIVGILRQRSRPYLFSNALPAAVCGATLRALELVSETTDLRDRLEANTRGFRERMTAAGFDIRPGVHPIVAILFSRFAPDDAPLAQRFARALLEEGIYVKGFFYPVVSKGLARIRVQVSAGHTPDHIDRAVAAFTKVGQALGVLST
jgi:glycine C-acetyltransferase